MINLPTKILLAIKPMRTQFKFTLRLICTPEYKYTPEYIYTCVFFAHANWTLGGEPLFAYGYKLGEDSVTSNYHILMNNRANFNE